MYVYACIHACKYECIYTHARSRVHTYLRIKTYPKCVCVQVHGKLSVQYIYIYIYIYIYTYVYIHTYIHTYNTCRYMASRQYSVAIVSKAFHQHISTHKNASKMCIYVHGKQTVQRSHRFESLSPVHIYA
jgi:hypothetical protein